MQHHAWAHRNGDSLDNSFKDWRHLHRATLLFNGKLLSLCLCLSGLRRRRGLWLSRRGALAAGGASPGGRSTRHRRQDRDASEQNGHDSDNESCDCHPRFVAATLTRFTVTPRNRPSASVCY